MIRKRIICCFCFLLLIPMPAFGDSIQTIKETAPGRWFAEIQTEEGNTVIVDAPVHIPNAETVSVLRVSDNCKVSELVGDETFLIGKADVRRREEIYDPNRFSEIGYTPEDLIVFLQGILNANDISDIDLIPYRAEALGSMCYVKSGRVFNRKYSFPCSVADTTKPWKHDTTKGYHITATQTISGIPVFALGYFSRNYLGFYSYLYYIDQDHYSVFLHTVSMDTVLSPDEQLLSFDALLEILTKRIRDGKLQKILEINLGYLPKNIKNGDQNDASSWLLIPVWQIRGYDTYLDPVLDGTLSVLSEEDRIQYDPDMICSIYINAITGEIEPTVSF